MIAIDLSLRAPAVCYVPGGMTDYGSIRVAQFSLPRIQRGASPDEVHRAVALATHAVLQFICELGDTKDTTVAIESPVFSKDAWAHANAGVYWSVRNKLLESDYSVQEVSPSAARKLAFGFSPQSKSMAKEFIRSALATLPDFPWLADNEDGVRDAWVVANFFKPQALMRIAPDELIAKYRKKKK